MLTPVGRSWFPGMKYLQSYRLLAVTNRGFLILLLAVTIPTDFSSGVVQAARDDIDAIGQTDATREACQRQDEMPQVEPMDELATLRTRVATLEERVATLERLLLSRIIDAQPEDREQLQSELQLARDRHEHSKRLFDKGYISRLELMATDYAVERAKLRIELASMAADQAEFAASMQLFEAQANLDLALQRLETSSNLAARGFITQTQLRLDQLDVERAKQLVKSLRERLEIEPADDDNSDQDH